MGRKKNTSCTDIDSRLNALEWTQLYDSLNLSGWALIENLIRPDECDALAALYTEEEIFRSRVVMARHGFGRGEYKYFAYPLPPVVAALRKSLYASLVPVANQWNELMKNDVRYPADYKAFIERCHRAEQKRPTPLLLRYGEGDYNCLHQDLYGEHLFPLQAVCLLSEPGKDFTGGEFIVTEQRPRMQSRAEVVPLRKGSLALLSVCHRPVQGARGYYRVNMRHGVSRLRSGCRYAAGIIFHDAS